MPNTAKKSETLEILISTMHKDSLSFLESMFPEGNYQEYTILIINQTKNKEQLKSNLPNIRVINSPETGLSLSRNLALKNAIGDICLIADDDVKYKYDFDKVVLNAFTKKTEADIITFKMVDEKGEDFKQYTDIKTHNKRTIKTVNSVVIAIRRKNCIEKSLFFNPFFGLGATFQTGDEYIFLRDALKTTLNIQFEPQVILSHNFNSSGRDSGSDRLVFSRAAIFYKYSGIFSYLRVIKYVYLIHKRGLIKTNQILSKLAIGFNGISAYRKICKKN